MFNRIKQYLNSFLLTVGLMVFLTGATFFAQNQYEKAMTSHAQHHEAQERDKLVTKVVEEYGDRKAEERKQIECLALNIYYEAGNEPMEGKLAVAQVTMNRTHTKGYPGTICAVVYQSTTDLEGNKVYQFSWVGEHHEPGSMNYYNWEESKWIAKNVLTKGVAHVTLAKYNVLFYHASYVNPQWTNVKQFVVIGRHVFYTSTIL